MAYGMTPHANWPSLVDFNRDMEELSRSGTKNSDQLALIESGRLVTAVDYMQHYGDKKDAIGFAGCNKRLKSYVQYHLTGKPLAERKVEHVSQNVSKEAYRITFGDLRDALSTMKSQKLSAPRAAPSTAQGEVLNTQQHRELSQFVLNKLRENKPDIHDLKTASQYLNCLVEKYPKDVQKLRDVYCSEVSDKFKKSAALLDELWFKYDYPQEPEVQSSAHVEQRLQPSPPPEACVGKKRSKLEKATVSSEEIAIAATYYKGLPGEAEDLLRRLDDWKKQDGPVKSIEQALTYLAGKPNFPIKANDIPAAMAAKDGLLAFANLPIELRPKPQNKVSVQVRELAVPSGTYRPANFSENRHVDCHPAPLSPEGQNILQRNNSKVTSQELEELEFRVVPEYQKVHQKIIDAKAKARDEGVGLPPGEGFPPKGKSTSLQHIPGAKSESSQEVNGVGLATAQGKRGNNEDTHVAQRFQIQSGGASITVTMTGVLDGHSDRNFGGHVSRHVAGQLQNCLRKRLEQYNPDGLTEVGVWNALKLALADVDRDEYLFQPVIDCSGTTVNLALVIGDRLWIVNVGDSRAMLAYPDGHFLQLSQDAKPGYKPWVRGSKPEVNEHSKRVEKRGGSIRKDHHPQYRVYPPPSALGGLSATAGAVGDHAMGGVLSARPRITSYPLDELQGAVLVQCCDGVFDVANCGQVSEYLRDKTAVWQELDTQHAAENLLGASYDAGSKDNLTVVMAPVPALQA